MNRKKTTLAVVGATGAVGQEIVRLLIERQFPFEKIHLFASAKSAGKTVHSLPVKPLESLEGIDLAFFAAGGAVSKEWIPKAKCICIDSSSAFRSTHPLIIPEINAHAMEGNLLTSPNCAVTILLMPLFRLHRLFGVKRIVVSTYQAASGAGAHLLNELQAETKAHLENRPYRHLLPFPYAFNLYPHNSPLTSSGYVEEELKMLHEARKILEDDSIAMSATCVRVPVLRAHSLSANVEFKKPFTLPQIYQLLENVPGLKIFEDRATNRFATPVDATYKTDVFCGRFRIDPSLPNTLEFWAVGDQLLKGAALNAVQIAERLMSISGTEFPIFWPRRETAPSSMTVWIENLEQGPKYGDDFIKAIKEMPRESVDVARFLESSWGTRLKRVFDSVTLGDIQTIVEWMDTTFDPAKISSTELLYQAIDSAADKKGLLEDLREFSSYNRLMNKLNEQMAE